MAYVSLYRKYRPQTFEDVVGQEHVTTVLRNAISQGRIASGYLFTGTRGTAKTTCARIFAKALNCIGPDGERTMPNPEPCGVCGPCQSIAASTYIDVQELDAASHGRIEEVRDIIDNIKFPPMEGRYKVYIIDEAHQLGTGAREAFLKTLEEPPNRVVFVLATTELDKIPPTIASRCQVFEFKRGSITQITGRLNQVLANEGVQAEPNAITLVARAADGSYRDSLSLLEQVLAYKRQNITTKDITTVLGAIDEDVLNRVVGLVSASDAAGAFALAGEILESGKDVRQFLRSLSARLRDLLFVGVGARPVSVGEIDDSPALRQQAAAFSPAALLRALEILTEAEQETKRSNQHRLLLEMTLLRLMKLPQTAGNPAPYVAPPAPVTQKAPPAALKQEEHAAASDVGAQHAAPTLGNAPSLSDALTAPAPAIPALSTPAPPELGAGGDSDIAPPPADDDIDASDIDASDLAEEDAGLDVPLPGDDDLDTLPLDDEALPTPSSPHLAPPELGAGGDSLLVTSADEREAADDFMQVQQVAVPEAAPAPNGNGHKHELAPDAPEELTRLQKSWQEVINRMGSRSTAGAVMIKDAHPVAFQGHTFTLEFANPLFVDKLESNEKGRKALEDIISKTLGAEPDTYRVKAVRQGAVLPAKVAMSTAPRARETAPAPQEHSPFLDEVIAVFGGQILDDKDTKG